MVCNSDCSTAYILLFLKSDLFVVSHCTVFLFLVKFFQLYS